MALNRRGMPTKTCLCCSTGSIGARRPGQSLFAAGELPSFLDHLEEALLFGTPVVTGRSYQPEWLLGNREINSDYRYLSGWIGYDTTGPGRRDYYDGSTKSWATELIEEQRTAKAPFAIAAETRILGVAKHPSFSSGTLSVVFEALLDGRRTPICRPQLLTGQWSLCWMSQVLSNGSERQSC